MSDKINIAVLGYGHIGKKHAELVSQHQSFNLLAVIDTDRTKFENKVAHSLNTFSSLDIFLEAHLAVDIIAICTPNGLHFQQAKKLLEKGIHVIIEKPITLRSGEAEILEQTAQKHGAHIFPIMQNRFSPPSQWLKELLESRTLGKIFMVQVSCYWNRDERYYTNSAWRGTKNLDGGTLYTQFSHFLDILHWLFGDLTNIKSKFANFNHQHLTEVEDSGIITFDFKSGGLGSFNFSTSVWQENLESSLTIIAENGSVKVGGQYMDKVEKCLVKNYTMPELATTNACNDYGTYKGSAQNHHHHYDNIAEVLLDNKKKHIQSHESVKLIQLIENIYTQS